ncbi:MAG: S41 family peptidase [Firmicutes bacterium]|nr:S41 family peptidase [Bacillota bacterium]
MRKKILAVVLALVIVFTPAMALAAQPGESHGGLSFASFLAGDELINILAGLREVELTPEAMEIALADFDYLVAKILDVAPTRNIIYRRLGVTAADYFAIWREAIYDNVSMPSVMSLLDPERWENEQTDALYIAADYLFGALFLMHIDLASLGHMGPQLGFIIEQTFFAVAHILYHGIEITEDEWEEAVAFGANREELERTIRAANNFHQHRYALYNTPAVLWFYGIDPSEFDFYVDIGDVTGGMDPNNITTYILEPGRIAYIHIASFLNNINLDSETLFPFYEEIQDFEHLIIDIRGNGGGWVESFQTNVVSMLIDDVISFYHFELYVASERTADIFEEPLSLTGGNLYGVFPVAEFIEARNMPFFAEEDIDLLDYATVWSVDIFPREDGTPFRGDIWLLVDGDSASASEMAANLALGTGFATVVGSPTAGVTGVVYTYAALPNTGILFRIDLGYTIDPNGRSIEEFGIIPEILNAPGMDALDTVLAVINGETLPTYEDWMDDLEVLFAQMFAEQFEEPILVPLPPPPPPAMPFASVPRMNFNGLDFVSLRAVADAHGYTVEWDGANNLAVVISRDGSRTAVAVSSSGTFNANGIVFVTASYAASLFADTVYVSPIAGTWTWDDDDSFIYIFNADGTGERGFPRSMISFNWFTTGTELRIDRHGYLAAGVIRNELWIFTINGDVLTLVSRQEAGWAFSYNRVVEGTAYEYEPTF